MRTHPNLPKDRSSSGAKASCSHFEITGPLSRDDPAQLSPWVSGRTCSKLRTKFPDTRNATYPRCTAFITAHVGSPQVGLWLERRS